jgi:hypothetical protein
MAPIEPQPFGPSSQNQIPLDDPNTRRVVTFRATFTKLSAPELVPLRPLGAPVEELEDIRAELIALFQKQLEALELDTFVGLTDVERIAFSARHNRIQELHAKLGQFKTAA